MRAGIPASRAAHATACPWLPALAATTPADRSRSESIAIRLTAPRTLNAPVRCRFSALSQTSRPTMREKVSEVYTGVSRATPARRRRASSMSASFWAVSVFIAKFAGARLKSGTGIDSEYLFKYLLHRRQRVELAALHLVEQAPQLGIVGDRPLQVRLRTRRGHREHLTGEVLAAPLVQQPVRLEVRAVLGDLVPELLDPLLLERFGEDDRRTPIALLVEAEDRTHLVEHRLRRRVVLLVDDDHVRDFHDSGLQRLHRVARARHQREHDGVGDADHLDLALTGPDCLEEDEIPPGCVEDEQGLQRRLGEPAQMAAGAHRADEDPGIEEVVGEPNPVAEQRALGERAGGIDGDDADRLAQCADVSDERADQGR